MSPLFLKVTSHHHFFTCNVKFFTHCFFAKKTPEGRKLYVVNAGNLCTDFDVVLPKPFSFRGLGPLTSPHQGLCPWTPLGSLPPDPRYRLALHALAICPRRLSPPLFGVTLRPCITNSEARPAGRPAVVRSFTAASLSSSLYTHNVRTKLRTNTNIETTSDKYD